MNVTELIKQLYYLERDNKYVLFSAEVFFHCHENKKNIVIYPEDMSIFLRLGLGKNINIVCVFLEGEKVQMRMLIEETRLITDGAPEFL